MRELLQKFDPVGVAFRNAVLALVGHCRVTLGEWRDEGIVEAAVATFEEFGGRKLEHEDTGVAFDVENFYFQVRGRRIRLCVEEYGEISLWGSKRLVTEISRRIAERLSTGKPGKGTA